ncbi:polysaccharide deacetylase family protein [Gallaecimonas kandeliae]|nr:polysaccharide deacetylase family protein [Gallaecimonas kandeliae]WKE67515.1 polysaccharide deacetylase family protein [Gallaecimonas kandeliae]
MRLGTALLFLLLLLLGLFGAWQLARSRHFQLFGDLVDRVDTDQKVVALTFDDGPSPGYTQALLKTLAAQGVKASFFLVGSAIEAHPLEAKLIAKAGHQLGNHSYSHQRMVLMSPAAVKEELERTNALIRQAGYQGPIYFRPPYGKKLWVLPWFLARHDILSVTWDLEPDSHPKVAGNSAAIARYVVDHARPGSIILLHVMFGSRQASMAAVPAIIQGLKAKGYRFVTLKELVALRKS